MKTLTAIITAVLLAAIVHAISGRWQPPPRHNHGDHMGNIGRLVTDPVNIQQPPITHRTQIQDKKGASPGDPTYIYVWIPNYGLVKVMDDPGDQTPLW